MWSKFMCMSRTGLKSHRILEVMEVQQRKQYIYMCMYVCMYVYVYIYTVNMYICKGADVRQQAVLYECLHHSVRY